MAANLTAGSIAFTGYNGDGNDNLSFVALTNIASGTVINFTDNAWNGTSFSSSESVFQWTATSDVAAGTIIDIDNIGSGTLGTNVGSVKFTNTTNTGLSNDSEVVYAFTGTTAAPTFLAAISNVGYGTSDGNLNNTGLVAGATAVSFTGGLDIMAYNGARTGQADFSSYLNLINNSANWITQDGSGNQSADGTAPNAPFATTPFTANAPAAQSISFSPTSVSVTEGDNGTKTMTFTVTRSGDTTGAISFSGTFDKGTTDAADFGGTLPSSMFNGTIAAGATSATVTVTISGDTTPEPSESFTLTLTSASNPSATVTIGTAAATGTIANDDGGTVVSSNASSLTIGNNDHVTILSNVTVSGSTAVTWTGGGTAPGAILDNFGNISGSTRAISTSGSSGGNLTIDNESGATIQAVKDAIKISNLQGTVTGTLTIVNDGMIKSTGTGNNAGQALDLDDNSSPNAHTIITNNATGVIQAADADAIRGGINATINNYGQIVSHNGSSSSDGNDAIDFQTRSGGVVNNYEGGLIDGARHGITGDAPINVSNNGTISGESGSGINLDTASTTTTVVVNSAKGVIVGHAVNGADADGVDVDGLVNIDNFGTIKAVGLTTDGLNEALAVGGGTIHNEVGGVIVSDQRAITVDDSNDGSAFAATTITNEGTIQGGNGEAISITGTFADTITNKGVIDGSVFTDGGNDTFDAYTGSSTSGLIDLGSGNDTVHLLGNGAGTFGETANVETLDVDAGTWTVDGTEDYNAINIAAGAAMVSQISVEHSMAITVGGSLTVADDRAITADDGLDDGSTLTVNVLKGGSITSGDDAIRIKGNFKDGTVSIDNAGTITANGGQAIDLSDVTAKSTAITITNEAGGIIMAIDADAVRGGGNTTIENFGAISSVFASKDLNDAIDFQDDGNGTVHNHAGGTIIGAHHGITGSQGITVINDANGTIIGQSGSAVNIDNDVTSIVTVTNYGTMLGMANPDQDDSDGDAVDVDGLLNLDNYGQIRGLGANGTHKGGANVSEGIAAGGGTINNYAGATIYGYGRAIQVDDSANGAALAATTIYNEGIIQGDGHGPENFEPGSDAGINLIDREAIDILGTFGDTITNKGQIIGGIFTDGGSDTFDAYVGSSVTGKIDLGDGNDTVDLFATDGSAATGILGAVVNAENLVVESGTWAVTDASSFSNIDVKGGAKIRNVQGTADPLALTGSQHLTVEQGGSVESYAIGFDTDGNPEEVPGTSLLLKGDLNAVIDNSGTIKGIAEVGTMDDVIFVPPTGNVTINNHETGVISGGIVLVGVTTTIDNSGEIIGADDNNTIAINASSAGTATTIVNHAGGLITTRADQNVIQAGAGNIIDNAGTIRSMDDYTDSDGNLIAGKDAIAFKNSTGGGSVHNEDGGLIEGSHHAVSGKGALTVINDEGGTMIGRNGSAVNVDNKPGVANTVFVTNHGTMLGQSMGYDDSDGDAVDVDALVKLDNYGTIRGEGANGTHNGGANVSEGVAIGGGVINNYAGATIYGYGRAIQVDDSANGPALAATTIYNEGTIQGDGHGPQNFEPGSDAGIVIAGREAIDILGSFADTITNTATGKIIGGIFTDGGNDTLSNAGSITAMAGSAVNMGDGDDTVTNTGIITGAVLLGAGDDTFNEYVGSTSGQIDGGDGNDTVNLYATAGVTATGLMSKMVNVENLNVVSGTWSNPAAFVGGTSPITGVTNVTVDTGATLVGSSISGAKSVTIQQGGTVTSGTGAAMVAFAINGGTLDNSGTMTGNSTSDVGGTLTVNGFAVTITNEATGVMSTNAAAVSLTSGASIGGTVDLENYGMIASTGGVGVDFRSVNSSTITINNHQGGSIKGVSTGLSIGNATSTTTVNNDGLIETTAAAGKKDDAISISAGTATIHNGATGDIEGSRHAITGPGGITVINDEGGLIVGHNGSAVNMDNSSDPSQTAFITNHGTMLGDSANIADSDGDAIDVDGLLQLDNYGSVRGEGANGYHGGTAAIDANISEGVAIGGGSIHNYEGGEIYGYGRAIEVDDSSNGGAPAAVTIINDGTIQGDGHGPTGVADADAATMQAKINGAEAIDTIGSQADTITNTATGKIIGGIFTDGGNDTLSNAGSITAMAGSAVNMGDGDDTVTNTGIITGTVLLGAGDDVFNDYAGSTAGTIDGGDGVDTINAYAAADSSVVGIVGSSTNVETLNIVSGSWKLGNGFSGANIEVENGATITSGSAATAMGLTGGQTLTVDQGGLVQGTKFAIGISGGDVDAVVINSGTIDVTSTPGTKADAITLNGATATIHNTSTGVIEGARHAITGPIGIHVINDAGGLIVGDNGSAVNMDNSETEDHAAFVTNYGTMLGKSANISDSDGDAVDVDGILHLDNYGSIRGEGANGYHDGEANVSEGVAIGGGTIHNYEGGEIYGYGRAIQVDNSSNGPALVATTIINDGTIQGDGNGPTGVAQQDADAMQARIDGREAIDILGSFADTITNTATGKIIGGIFTDGGNDILNNAGLIDGKVDMGAGDDQVNLTGNSQITGTIVLGDGNDVLTDVVSSTSAITVDAGAGNDILTGGGGNDTLIGGTGSDTFNYFAGDGNDTIVEGAGNAGDFDTLNLSDFNISDVTLARHGEDLVITTKDGSTIVVSDQFDDGGVENIVFKDGSIDRNGVVDATNHAPTVDATTHVTSDEDHTTSGAIAATDADGDKLTYTLVDDGATHHGSFVLMKDGTWNYAPDQDFNGHDSFVVAVSDGHATVQTTIDVTINPVNDAPVATNDVGQVGEHDVATFDLVANDKDVEDGHPTLKGFSIDSVDGIDLSKDAAANAFHIVDGKLQFDGGDIFGALNDGDQAHVSITYTAEDSNGAQTTGEFMLTVNGVTDMHVINGTNGPDVLFDTAGDDHIIGGDGADVIFTASGSDIVDAGAGNDTVMALTGNATVNGGDGNDTIVGGSGNTVLNGDAGNDTITGGSGNEVLNGGAGNDTLISNSGNDRLVGGQGNDLLIGGTGSDTFVFKPGDGQDTVANFKADGPVHDVIEVDSHSFANFDALMAAVHDTATGVQLQYTDGSTLTLSGITKAHLTVDDFHFA